MKDASGLKTGVCILVLTQNTKEFQDRAGYRASLSTALCDRPIPNEHKNATELRLRTFKVLPQKIHVNSNS